jgi:hypothetical protein
LNNELENVDGLREHTKQARRAVPLKSSRSSVKSAFP